MRLSRDSLRRRVDRWLFRVGDPEPSPIVLGQRRIFVLPTPAGIAFGLALLVMLIASINYNLSLGFGFVFLLGGTGVASILHAFRTLLRLALAPGRVDAVFAGEKARFHLLVHNERQVRRPALRLKAREGVTAFELPAADTAEVVLEVPAPRRGWLPLGRLTLETTYPLGLIRAWSVIVPDARCLVYPSPEPEPPALPAQGLHAVGHRTGGAGQDDFAGLRGHLPSDSPRHVSWKTLARGGPMLTKQFAGMDGGEIHLDWDKLPTSLGVEQRLSRLAAWILAAQRSDTAFSLALPGDPLERGRGPAHCAAALRRLALFRTEGAAG